MICDILLSYFVIVPAAALCYFPMRDHLKHSRGKTMLTLILTLTFAILFFTFLEYKLQTGDNAFLLPILVILFGAYYFCFDTDISQSLAVFVSSIALFSILSNLSFCIDALYDPSAVFIVNSSRTYWIQIFISVLTVAFLAWPYSKYGSILIREMTAPRVWYTTVLISGAFFAVNMFLLQFIYTLKEDRRLMLHMLFLLLVLLVLWFLLQALFFFIVSGIIRTQKAAERLHFLEMQESQFNAQQRYIKATAQVRHDFRQSVQTLNKLYESGQYEAIGQYLQQYVRSIPASEIVSYCENIALNALLNFYVHLANQNQIRFTVRVEISRTEPVSDIDLCNMVGNILENAVVACQQTERRFIQMTVLTEENEQLYIVSVNSFDGHVRMRNGKYLSTNRSGEGLGLSSIAATAEKYGGLAQFSHDETCFYSNVAIPLTQSAGVIQHKNVL